jgi:hypothetical protein
METSMYLKSLIMPAVLTVALIFLLPVFGVQGTAVYGFAAALAAWAWGLGRVTRMVAQYCLQREWQGFGLLLTLFLWMGWGFGGSVMLLGWLCDSYPQAAFTAQGQVAVAAITVVSSIVLRIIVSAIIPDQDRAR